MKKLTKKEMNEINGGAISPTSSINALIKAIGTLFNVGQAVGNAIRRATMGKACNV